ncbi:uncharacterized protein LOC116434716 isoform X2 [Nomia melanderi]|uniref:uncharacterized protein LOC116434716 isoform X2 n=1 Tax=Nomia melanderi TaxID=2448451 RepID=UPI003FCE46EB
MFPDSSQFAYTKLSLNKATRLCYEKRYSEFVQSIPPMTTLVLALIKYGNVMSKMETVKSILLSIKKDNERYRDLPESRILDTYNMQGRLFIQILGGYLFVATLIFLSLPTPNIIKDGRNLRNVSEPRTLYPVDYNVDHVKYYVPITVHAYLVSCLVVYMIVAMESLFIVVIQHSCILFTVAGYKLKTSHILNESIPYRGDEWTSVNVQDFSAEEQQRVFRNILRSIMEHNKALEYVTLLQSTFSTALFFQISLTIGCMSSSAVQLLWNLNNLDIVLGMILWLVGQVMHLLFLCLNGQRLSNFCENLYYDAMQCLWYTFFAKSKVVYRFLIMNIATPRQLVAMKLVVLNMQTFQTVARLSASYFTVLSSTL